MRNNHIKRLNKLLKQHGYEKLSTIDRDDYSRFNGIIVDQQKKKYFIKVVIDKDSYEYRSLYLEAKITKYLSEKTRKLQITYKGYRLYAPTVAKIINQDEIFCLITHHVEGKKLISEPSNVQANVLLATLELVEKLSKKTRMSSIRSYLKNYTRMSLIFSLPIRFIKAIILCPFAAPLLLRAFWKALSLIYSNINGYGLVHADITATNIIFHKRNIYLTDWEEAGWGISAYNTITPLCVHWQNQKVREILFRRLQDNGQNKTTIPLLAYRTLMFFNQHIERGGKKRKRDFMLLKFLESM